MISDLRPGLQFHQYQLLEQIGVGGQGVVWSAEDLERKDIVAIKFNEILGSEEQQADDEMFQRQLGKLLNVHHANILPIYDCGLENFVRYLVSPYIAGGSLFDRLKGGPLAVEDALRLSSEIASALDYLHGQGIIHRDITSSNVLLNSKNHAYLADFGLARIISNTTLPMHTGRGTAVYSPPEQHKRLEITPQSDIYSFGILLFELFTGVMPWDGETVLGIQQLYSDVQLPDPCELNNALPPLMKDVLRRVTLADPAKRPSTGAEVMKMLHYIFNVKDVLPSIQPQVDRAVIRSQDAEDLLRRHLDFWKMGDEGTEPGLTKFSLINLDYRMRDEKKVDAKIARFMSYHSMLYGQSSEIWWPKVVDPQDRLAISLTLINRRDEETADRILDYLVRDEASSLFTEKLAGRVAIPILEMASNAADPLLARKLLSGFQALVPPVKKWGDSILKPETNRVLGKLAVEDSDVGDQAARLTGHLRSRPVLDLILRTVEANRLVPVLLEVQQTAGHLPAFVPRNIRLKVSMEWIVQRLAVQPAQLFGVYMLALAGATLGIGSQVYATYRLPEFMDMARISSSLEQGLIIGALFSLGIFISKVVVERFAGAKVFPRLLLGTVLGTAGMNIAMFAFHVLFLNTPPSGFLITFGCALIAFAFSLGGLIKLRPARMALATAAVTIAIAGTWWLHTLTAESITEMTPMFRYDYNWAWWQVLLTSFIVAAWMGILANLVPLHVDEARN